LFVIKKVKAWQQIANAKLRPTSQ